MSFDSLEFRRVLGNFPTGVTVVTAMTSHGPVGLTIGSFASVSLEPPLVMFCPDKRSGTWEQISQLGRFCVNVLGADQSKISSIFAGKAANKFDGVAWHPLNSGAPIIDGTVAWIDCVVHATHDGGDHEIVVGQVEALAAENDHSPLIFFKGAYGRFTEI